MVLAAFYLQPGKQTGSVEFAHKSFSEFLCAERLKESLENWTEPGRKGRGFNIQQDQMDWEIYDLLGYGGLTPEIVEYLMGLLTTSDLTPNPSPQAERRFRPVQLFQRLHDFYERWCEGEFIDAYTETLPQKKSRQLHEQNISLGQRQVDIYAGLNVMILLLELHRYAQEREDWKEQIIFYPSGEPDEKNPPTNQLLRIINYSDCIQLGTFNNVVGEFLNRADLNRADLSNANLSNANLSGANLSDANLSDADLSNADLSGAYLSDAYLIGAYLSGAYLIDANLIGADLSGADLIDANLSRAYLSDADLSRAYLSDADLSGADLSGADLSGAYLSGADLSGANLSDAYLSNELFGDIRWDEGTKWEGVRGLETAINVPEALKQQLGLA